MKNQNRVNKTAIVMVRLTKVEAESLQKEATDELLSLSAVVRRKLFYNSLKAIKN